MSETFWSRKLESFLKGTGRKPEGFQYFFLLPLRVLAVTIKQFLDDRCMQRASSLAYTTLLSLIPLTVIFFIFFRFTPTFEQLQNLLVQFISQNIPISSAQKLNKMSLDFLNQINPGKIGVLGFITFLITSIALLATIEKAFNIIWKVEEHRRPLNRFMIYWFILSLGPIIVGLSIYWSTHTKLSSVMFSSVQASTFLGISLNTIYPFLFSFLAMVFSFSLIPHTRVKLKYAILGGLFAAFLWEMAKKGFGIYLSEVAIVHRVFGTLGLIPVFLLWLYLTWVIVLLGAELTYSLQNFTHLARQRFRLREGAIFLEYAALRIVLELGRRFEAGEDPATESALVEASEVPQELVSFICNALEERHLLARTNADPQTFTPARDPAKIELNHIIDAVRHHSAQLYPLPKDREAHYFEDLLSQIDIKSRESLEGMTLSKALQDLKLPS